MFKKVFLLLFFISLVFILVNSQTKNQTIRILNPRGGEQFPHKSPIRTCWKTGVPDFNVKIELKKKGAGVVKVLSETNNVRYPDCFEWIPNRKEVLPGKDYYIRISSTNYPGAFARSNKFDIVRTADLLVYSRLIPDKRAYTTGEKAVLWFFIRNYGQDPVNSIKVKIWTLAGEHLHTTWKTVPPTRYLFGKSGMEKIINQRLAPNGEIEQKLNVEIKDKKTGYYTLCLMVMSLDDEILDPVKGNNINSGVYQVVYKLKPIKRKIK